MADSSIKHAENSIYRAVAALIFTALRQRFLRLTCGSQIPKRACLRPAHAQGNTLRAGERPRQAQVAMPNRQPQAGDRINMPHHRHRARQAWAVPHPVRSLVLRQRGEGVARNALYMGSAARVGGGFQARNLDRAAHAQTAFHGGDKHFFIC